MTSHHSDERGASMSAFVTVVMLCLLLMAGLVIDGGAKVEGTRRAEAVAAQAARAGAEAGAAARATGLDPMQASTAAAREVVASSEFTGTVQVSGDRVVVDTHGTVEVTFLSLIGVSSLPIAGHADATAVRR